MIITIIAVLLLGMALGVYIASQIEIGINKSMFKKNKVDTKNNDSNLVFKEMGVVKKWTYTYTDKNGNTINTTDYNDLVGVIDKENPPKPFVDEDEERSECCGAKMDTDQRLCYGCKDHC